MSYVVIAHNSRSAFGTSVPDALEALSVMQQLRTNGFEVSAVVNDLGVAVDAAELELLVAEASIRSDLN